MKNDGTLWVKTGAVTAGWAIENEENFVSFELVGQRIIARRLVGTKDDMGNDVTAEEWLAKVLSS